MRNLKGEEEEWGRFKNTGCFTQRTNEQTVAEDRSLFKNNKQKKHDWPNSNSVVTVGQKCKKTRTS